MLPFGNEAARLGLLVVIGVGVYVGIFYALDREGFRGVVKMVRDILVPAKRR
jgi:hypothetical protein